MTDNQIARQRGLADGYNNDPCRAPSADAPTYRAYWSAFAEAREDSAEDPRNYTPFSENG